MIAQNSVAIFVIKKNFNIWLELTGKKKNAMNDAVSGTEAIRTWDEHRIGIPKLCEKYETNIVTGLNDE